MAKVRQTKHPRKQVPAKVLKQWRAVRKVKGAEKMYAALSVECDLGMTTSRNAIEQGIAAPHVEQTITEWCNKQPA